MTSAELWKIVRTGIGLLAILALGLTGLVVALSSAAGAAEEDTPVRVGFSATDFTLSDTAGHSHTLSQYLADGQTVVLEWFNPFCPYVRKYHDGDANPSIREAYGFAQEHGVVWLAINSNAPGKQGSGLELNAQKRAEYGMSYPLLLDESGRVGQAYGATSTPQLFIITPENKVIYNGGADDTVLASDTPSINYVINALTQYMAGEEIEPAATKHPGCSVKYAD
jgi:peroxiredoxin